MQSPTKRTPLLYALTLCTCLSAFAETSKTYELDDFEFKYIESISEEDSPLT